MIVAPGVSVPSRSAASIIDSAMRSLIEPVGFWFSSFTKSWHGPVSMRVISSNGVSPIRRRISGGFPRAFSAARISVGARLMVSEALLLPLVHAICEHLLQHLEADFAIVERVAKVASLVDPR